MTQSFCDKFGLGLPILQAPMAGVATPAMAAAVSQAGALGGLGLGASSPDDAGQAIRDLQARTPAPFNVNFFCHAPPSRDDRREQGWIDRTGPLFAEFDAAPPATLN